jgi:ribonuclease-3
MEHHLLAQLEEIIGYRFRRKELLVEALTHPSFTAENQSQTPHNQRLEFLGDAVLQHAITELLFYAHPQLQEGNLSKIRSALTKDRALVSSARLLGLGQYLRLGRGEEQSGGRDRDSNLADVFEAVIGALYLDGGLEPTTRLLQTLVGELIQNPWRLLETENPKGTLQEYAQEKFQTAPTYEVVRVTGPEHEPEFEVTVAINDQELARARAGSRKKAEKKAALAALHQLTGEADDAEPHKAGG